MSIIIIFIVILVVVHASKDAPNDTPHHIKPQANLSAMRGFSSDTSILIRPNRTGSRTPSPNSTPPLQRRNEPSPPTTTPSTPPMLRADQKASSYTAPSLITAATLEGIEGRLRVYEREHRPKSPSPSSSPPLLRRSSPEHSPPTAKKHKKTKVADNDSSDSDTTTTKVKGKKMFRRFSSSASVKKVRNSSSSSSTTNTDEPSTVVKTGSRESSPKLTRKGRATSARAKTEKFGEEKKRVLFSTEDGQDEPVQVSVSPRSRKEEEDVNTGEPTSLRFKESKQKWGKRSKSSSPRAADQPLKLATPVSDPSLPQLSHSISTSPPPPPSLLITVRDAAANSKTPNHYMMFYGNRSDNKLTVTAVQWMPVSEETKKAYDEGKRPFPMPPIDDDVMIGGHVQTPLAYCTCHLDIRLHAEEIGNVDGNDDGNDLDNNSSNTSNTASNTEVYAELDLHALKLYVLEPGFPVGNCVIISPKKINATSEFCTVVSVDNYRFSFRRSVLVANRF